MHPSLLAGVARRTISPPKGIYLVGYADRLWGNPGVHDDLTATALALSDGEHQAVIVACDLLAINERTVARVQSEAGDDVVICCSHTHSGPIAYAGKRSPRRNRAYVDFLVDQIVDSVQEARTHLQPARLSWAPGEVGIAINRRERKGAGGAAGPRIEIGHNPDGIVDRSMGIVQVQAASGKPLATLVNLACHNTVLGPKNLLVSADWAGAMRRHIETHTGALCLYIQGATGDLNPDYEWGRDDWSVIERTGGMAAEQVFAALERVSYIPDSPVSFHSQQVWLPLDVRADSPEPPPTYRRALAGVAHVPRFLVDPVLNWRYPWRTEVAARDGYWAVPMALTIVRAGDLALVAFGAEVFTEIGLRIKAESPLPHTLFSGVGNGCIGYLPTAEEHALGGYEVDLAPYFYRLPGRLRVDAAELAIEQTLEVIRGI